MSRRWFDASGTRGSVEGIGKARMVAVAVVRLLVDWEQAWWMQVLFVLVGDLTSRAASNVIHTWFVILGDCYSS
jgi:hypothetical protein